MKEILEEMNGLTDKEMAFWRNVQDISKVKTILGLIDEYESVNGLIEMGYPAINKAIYSHEQEILTTVTQIQIIGVESLCKDID